MGRRPKPRGRDVHGVVLLDKPLGLSSNQALQRVKRLFKANRAGHTGTLDPMATGLLPICLGEATKVAAYLTDADKAYTARMQLGVNTTTGDKEGDVILQRPVSNDWQAQLVEKLADFTGEQQQVPPMYSALKVNGTPLYRLAREGIEIERKKRTIRIHKLTLLEQGDDWAEFYVSCSKGTYVRTLAEDMGEALSCGAHLTMLRRCEVAPYDNASMLTLEQIEALAEESLEVLDENLQPPDTALQGWSTVAVTAEQVVDIKHGKSLEKAELDDGWYRVLFEGQLLCLGEKCADGMLYSRRLLHIV